MCLIFSCRMTIVIFLIPVIAIFFGSYSRTFDLNHRAGGSTEKELTGYTVPAGSVEPPDTVPAGTPEIIPDVRPEMYPVKKTHTTVFIPVVKVTSVGLFNETVNWAAFKEQKDETQILANGVVIRQVRFDSLSAWQLLPVNLSLPWNNNFLVFRYSVISLLPPSRIRYTCMLEGLEDHWNTWTTNTEVSYGNLTPGSYVFKVRAINGEGIRSPVSAFAFTIRPPWWRTTWALLFFTLLLLILIISAFWYVAEIHRREIRMITRERSRIARELHDDVGAELTRITILSQNLQKKPALDAEILEKLQKISDTGKRLLGSIGEIIWAMNPRQDNLESLTAYILKYVTEYLDTAGIRVKIEYPDTIPGRMVSDPYRRNVFLAVKEAVSNITRHSKATEVRFSLFLDDSQVTIEMADNGSGFSPEIKNGAGNGLKNMQERMKEVGGSFGIFSEPGKGALVRFRFPSC